MKYACIPAALAAALVLSGCASTPAPVFPADALTPQQAVFHAAQWAPRVVKGSYSFEVKAVGSQGEMAYVNSEADYRDQRNLSLAVTPQARGQLEAKLGAPLATALLGKRLLVRGSAQRVQIGIYHDSVRTDKYYYQTHVQVTDASQIELI